MKCLFNGLFIAISLMFVVSCDLIPTHVTVEFNYKKFREQKSQWNSSKPSNYQYNLVHWSNGYSFPVNTLIFVEDNNYKEQISHVDEYGYMYESSFYLTITEIYESIEENYKRYNDAYLSKNYFYLKKIEIIYDTENHIPTEIKMYYHVPANVADASSYAETKISAYKVNN